MLGCRFWDFGLSIRQLDVWGLEGLGCRVEGLGFSLGLNVLQVVVVVVVVAAVVVVVVTWMSCVGPSVSLCVSWALEGSSPAAPQPCTFTSSSTRPVGGAWRVGGLSK